MKSYELTEEEKARLNPDELKKYEHAIYLCGCENAGGPGGGWANGHEILLSLGWRKVERTEGHRTFVRLEKPTQT